MDSVLYANIFDKALCVLIGRIIYNVENDRKPDRKPDTNELLHFLPDSVFGKKLEVAAIERDSITVKDSDVSSYTWEVPFAFIGSMEGEEES